VVTFETIQRDVLSLGSPNYSCKFKQSGPDKFSMKPFIFQVKTAIWLHELRKTQHKTQQNNMSIWARHWTWYSTKCCRVQLDIGPIMLKHYRISQI